MAKPEEMYQCQMTNCGYIYDPDKGDRKSKTPAFKPLAGPGSVAEGG